MVFGIVAAVVVLGLLIVVHEFGHFLLAKRLGVGVLRFSVGFGPRVFARTVNGTEYALSAIPLGGYVKMAGEDPEAEESVDPRISFSHQALWKRTAIVGAGPGFNIAFAFVALSAVFWLYGAQVPNPTATIGGVMEDMPAARAGLRSGDVVTAVSGQAVGTWKDLSAAIRGSEGREITLSVVREGAPLTISVRAQEKPEKTIFGEEIGKAYFIGIEPRLDREMVGLLRAVAMGASQTVFLAKTIVRSVVKIIQGRISREDIGGPILIVQAAGQHARVGFENLLHFMALISINLGILNLLPIPVLDGGHLFFFVIEAVMRRPLDMRHREIAQQVGLVILIGLMAFAFYNDIARVIRGWG
jgi:regulator of sigma E protease